MQATRELTILGISGSLRRESFNTKALAAAREEAPEGVRIEPFDLAPIPLYNEDVRQQGLPEPVQTLRSAIAEADGLLIATPEYNYSIPGVLKNAIDWASRPPDQPFDGKRIAIMGASPGRFGTARSQYHLRQVFVGLNGQVLTRPEVMIAGAGDLFDDAGRLTDDATRGFVRRLVEALAEAVRRERAQR